MENKVELRKKIGNFLNNINSPDSIYELFKLLNYPENVLLTSQFKRKLDEFDMKEEIKQKINNIYTLLNFEKNLVAFIVELKHGVSFSSTTIREISKSFSNYYENFLLIISSPDYYTLLFVLPEFERLDVGKHKLKITKLFLQRDDPYYTAIEVLSNLYYDGTEKNWRDVYKKWKEAFSVERVTESFFEDYKKIFFKIRDELRRKGINKGDSHEFALQLLNRIMFIYFIAKKGWLNKDKKFMRNFWSKYKEERNKGNVKKNSFYNVWLKNLFFKAFNRRQDEIKDLPEYLVKIFYNFPYLNGSLFLENRLDKLEVNLDDDLFSEIFEVFNKYNFTIKEDMPLEQEVAVDPVMIGYVYESLAQVAEEIYDRRGLGIFYTPRIEIDFMCRRAVVEYLSKKLPNIPKEKIYEFVFDEEKQDAEKFFTQLNIWHKLEEVLDNLTVVDPACGSGSFLVGMMNVIFELYKVIYKNLNKKWSVFNLKSSIVRRSLYGVDVMPWAIRTAELRLWLQLIIEEDFTDEQLKEKPLLPNFDFNLRVGNSIIQEIGGIIFDIKNMQLSERLKNKLYDLKREKENYYNNLKTKFKSKEDIFIEEVKLFEEIIEEHLSNLKEFNINLENELRKLEKVIQKDLFGRTVLVHEEKIKEIKDRIEMNILEIDKLSELKNKLKDALKNPETKPFVWEIDFAEIFGSKGGFDIVIGNPPYVRQEKISPPNKIKAKVTLEDKREYKEKLFKAINSRFPVVEKIDKKSDYYVYFYFYCLSLLNEKGVFCFITSNSWLDVEFGKDLQEFLLKYVPIIAIYDYPTRSFEHADINTIIALFSAPYPEAKSKFSSFKWPALNNFAKFVMLRKPFENIMNSKILIEIEKIKPKVKGGKIYDLVYNIEESENYKVFSIYQEDLLEDGWEYPEGYDKSKGKFKEGNYVGNKWGGKYLRVPKIYWKILEKGKDKLVRLGDIAEVRRGFTTGANEFFYLKPVGKTVKEVVEIAEKNPDTLIRVRNGAGWEGEIEAKFLKPVIKSPRELKTIIVRLEDLHYLVFMCNKSKEELKGTRALEYIKWGEKQGYHELETVRNRNPWFALKFKMTKILMLRASADRPAFYISEKSIFHDQTFYSVNLKNQEFEEILGMLFNNTFTNFLSREIESGASSSLGQGVKWSAVYESKRLLVLIPKIVIKKKLPFIKRLPSSIFTELGFDPNKPIREQEPNPLPDRKALDDIVFDALGLTEEERKEVYWAVAELVKSRLEKAKSLKKEK
ncbi:MAG: DNA methyltransferase [Candidatus Aenigmatarchaeota archaeon]